MSKIERPHRIKDIKGQIFHRLTVLHMVSERQDNRICWLCRCICGKEVVVKGSNLRRNLTKSCGCWRVDNGKKLIKNTLGRSTTHGMSGTSTYITWKGMRSRCYYSKSVGFHRYGGRGIEVCPRWKDSFENFLKDMGKRPEPHPTEGAYSIERLDYDGNYEPSNCVWATALTQGSNTTRNHFLTMGDETYTVTEWGRRTGLTTGCIHGRLGMGWSVGRALTTPKGPTGRPRSV